MQQQRSLLPVEIHEAAKQLGILTIVAGGGLLPRRVAEAARVSGRSVFIIGLRGHVDAATLHGFGHEIVRIGAAATIRAAMIRAGTRDIVLAGSVRRPSLLELRPDAEMRGLMARIGRDLFRGDDGLLAAIVRVLSQEGFCVVGAHEILGGASSAAGALTVAAPDEQGWADIDRAVMVADALGRVDVGQGCVVQQGFVLAVEAVEGTDAMLSRAAGLKRSGPGGVLVKMVKPGQERRVDLPTIGPDTVAAAVRAGLRGIAFEADGCLVIDRAATIAAADRAGLFLQALSPAMVRAETEPTGAAVP